MQFLTSALFALTGAGYVLAQTANGPNSFNVPPGGYQTSAGSMLNISWTPTVGDTVTLYLRSGDSAYLNNGTAIASNLPNKGQYTWSVPSSIIRGSSYALEIVDDQDTSQVNYSPQFIIDSNNLYSSTFGVSSGAATSTVSASGTTSGASAMSTSGSTTMSASSGASMSATTSTTGTTSAGVQSQTRSGGVGPRATAAVGVLGAIALGALAL